jgi:hypothetical protein
MLTRIGEYVEALPGEEFRVALDEARKVTLPAHDRLLPNH